MAAVCGTALEAPAPVIVAALGFYHITQRQRAAVGGTWSRYATRRRAHLVSPECRRVPPRARRLGHTDPHCGVPPARAPGPAPVARVPAFPAAPCGRASVAGERYQRLGELVPQPC